MKYGKKNIFEVDFLIFQNESNNDAYVQPIVEGRCSFSFSNRNNLNDKVSIVFWFNDIELTNFDNSLDKL